MYDILRMNELDRFTDLSHDADARLLCQQKVFADGAIKQLAAVYTAPAITITYRHDRIRMI